MSITISILKLLAQFIDNNFNIEIVIDIISITIPNIEIVDTIYDNNFNIEIVIDIISITIPNIEIVNTGDGNCWQDGNCRHNVLTTIPIKTIPIWRAARAAEKLPQFKFGIVMDLPES